MFKRMMTAVAVSTVLLGSLTACNDAPTASEPAPVNHPTSSQSIGINLNAMDTNVKPGDDFYNYANGNWQRDTQIPADRSSTGAFLVAFNATEKHKAALIDELIHGQHAAGSDEALIADFYKAYTNTAAIDAAGMQPLAADFARYAAISNLEQLSSVLGSNLRADVDPLNATHYATENLFGVFVTQGLATPGEVLPYILQGGLGLPEREYYLSTDPKMVQIRQQYQQYIQKLLSLAGVEQAAEKAARIFSLETKIAQGLCFLNRLN